MRIPAHVEERRLVAKARAATRNQAFAAQKSLILDLIRRRGPISRRDVGRELHLHSSNVSFHVAQLMERSILEEVGQDKASTGRPAILLDFRPGGRLVAGVLVEVHRVSGVVADLRGNVLRSEEISLSPDPDGREVVEAATSLAKSLIRAYEKDLFLGLGAAVPGFLDAERGVWEEFGLMPLCRGTALGPALSESCGLTVFLENDTRSGALAEKWFAPERDFDDLLFVEISEGLGSAMLVDGRLRYGASDTAGELGHISIDPNGERCYCGGRGCLELRVRDQELYEGVRRRLDGTVDSVLPRLVEGDLGELSMDIIRQALDAADKPALEALEEFCVPLGIGLANAINFLNPSHVVIGGPFARLGEHLLGSLLREIKARAISRAVQALDLRISELAESPKGLIAAAVVLEARFSGQGAGRNWQSWK